MKFIQGFGEYRLTLHQLLIHQIIFVETRVLTGDIFPVLSGMAVGISLHAATSFEMNILLSATSVMLVSLPKSLSGSLGLLFVCRCKKYVGNSEGISSRRSKT